MKSFSVHIPCVITESAQSPLRDGTRATHCLTMRVDAESPAHAQEIAAGAIDVAIEQWRVRKELH